MSDKKKEKEMKIRLLRSEKPGEATVETVVLFVMSSSKSELPMLSLQLELESAMLSLATFDGWRGR